MSKKSDHTLYSDDDLKAVAEKFGHLVNRNRRQRMREKINFYDGIQRKYMEDWYRANYPADHDKVIKSLEVENITKSIINKIALVYKDPPERSVVDVEGEIIESDNDLFNEIVSGSNLNTVLKVADRYTRLCGTCGIKVAYRDGIDYDFIMPDILTPIFDKSDIMTPVGYVWPTAAGDGLKYHRDAQGNITDVNASQIEFEFWSNSNHVKYPEGHFLFKNGEIISVNEGDQNPFVNADGKSIMPVIIFNDSYPTRQWFVETGEDLFDAQRVVNEMATALSHSFKMQGFSTLVVAGADEKDKIEITLTDAIRLPHGLDGQPNPDAKYISPSPKLQELMSAIEQKIKRVAQIYNLSIESFTMTGSVASGISLKLKNMNLLEDREDRIDLYRGVERQIFDVIRAVNNEFNTTQISGEGSVLVDFAEIKFPESPAEEFAQAKMKFELGLDNPLAWLMRENPDLTEDAAEELLKKNIEINRRMRDRFGLFQSQINDVSTGLDDEQN